MRMPIVTIGLAFAFLQVADSSADGKRRHAECHDPRLDQRKVEKLPRFRGVLCGDEAKALGIEDGLSIERCLAMKGRPYGARKCKLEVQFALIADNSTIFCRAAGESSAAIVVLIEQVPEPGAATGDDVEIAAPIFMWEWRLDGKESCELRTKAHKVERGLQERIEESPVNDGADGDTPLGRRIEQLSIATWRRLLDGQSDRVPWACVIHRED